jgi:hypothetical protein
MHVCSEMLSLILFPLLPPLDIVVLIIVHLMIIASLALPFHARSNPATPSPRSQRQIVSLGGGGRGMKLRSPCQKAPFVNF